MKFVDTREWTAISDEFHSAALPAVPDTYFCWFRCGVRLGDWVCEHATAGEPSPPLGEMVQAFQHSVLELPPTFQTQVSWLKRLAKFKFREYSATELSRLLEKPREPNKEGPEDDNYQFQLDLLYHRMFSAIMSFAGTCPKPECRHNTNWGRR